MSFVLSQSGLLFMTRHVQDRHKNAIPSKDRFTVLMDGSVFFPIHEDGLTICERISWVGEANDSKAGLDMFYNGQPVFHQRSLGLMLRGDRMFDVVSFRQNINTTLDDLVVPDLIRLVPLREDGSDFVLANDSEQKTALLAALMLGVASNLNHAIMSLPTVSTAVMILYPSRIRKAMVEHKDDLHALHRTMSELVSASDKMMVDTLRRASSVPDFIPVGTRQPRSKKAVPAKNQKLADKLNAARKPNKVTPKKKQPKVL